MGVSILDCFVDIELCQKVSLWQTLLGNSISDVQTKQSWIWTSWMQLEFNILKQKANREYLLFFSSKLCKIFSTTVWGAFFVYSLLCSPGGLAISFYLLSFSKLCKIFSTTRWDEVLFTLCFAHLVQTVQDIFYPEQQYEVHSLFTLCYAHQVGWQYLHCTTENNKPGQTPFNTGSKANTAEMQQQKKE